MPEKDVDTLLGVDTNKNGVRDDVEHFIYKQLANREIVFRAFLKLAQSLTSMIVSVPDEKKVKSFHELMMSDSDCVSSLVGEESIYKNHYLVSKVLNTKQRIEAKKKASDIVGSFGMESTTAAEARKKCR